MRSPGARRRTWSIAAASGTAYGVESAMPWTTSYDGSPPGSSGASHIWTKRSGVVAVVALDVPDARPPS